MRRVMLFVVGCWLVALGWLVRPALAAEPVNGFPNPCGYNPAVDGPIPSGVNPCSQNGFKFNSNFYYQEWVMNSAGRREPPRQLIVYGSPDAVPQSVQRFKKGWQRDPNDPNSVNLNEGHFYVWDPRYGGYVFGEYKFLGYTENGGLYHNIHYINDAEAPTANAAKHWVFQPWNTLPEDYKYRNGADNPGSVYFNKQTGIIEDPMLDKFSKFVSNLNNSLGFRITQGIDYKANPYRVLPNESKYQDPRNYVVIHQPPTAREGGFGTMFHYSWISHRLWYQTFPLARLKANEKYPTPVSCTAEAGLTPVGKSRTVALDVTVRGLLDDAAYFGDDQGEALYYTRKDILYWQIELFDPAGGVLQAVSGRDPNVTIAGNTVTARLTLNVNTDRADKSDLNVWKYTANARVTAVYANDTPELPSRAVASCQLNASLKANRYGTMKSLFRILPEKRFTNKAELTTLEYRDLSYGQDADYYIIEITNADTGESAVRTFDPAVPERKPPDPKALDQRAVDAFLASFVRSQFADGPASARVVKTFHVKQTIVDRDAAVNNRSVHQETFVAVHEPVQTVCQGSPPPMYITPKADWPEDWFDVLPLPVTDAPPETFPSSPCVQIPSYDQFTRTVTIDGTPVDAAAFFAGRYIFGENSAGLHEIKVVWTAPDGTPSHLTKYIVVHDTKPRVSLAFEGLFKQNRTMKVTNTSRQSNDPWVEARFPIQITSFSYVDPDDPNLVYRAGYGEDNLEQKLFMYKQPGRYRMSVAAKRVLSDGKGYTVTRYSDPYVVEYEILPDHKPAIIAHAYQSQVSRLDQLELYYDVQSTDGDFVAWKKLTVYYDADNDGTFETKVFESTGDVAKLPKFSKVGQYKIVAEAREGTNQDRLMEFVTPDMDQTNVVTAYFFVDNYEPSSDLYVDVPNEKPDLDVMIMLDANLNQASADWVKNNRVSLVNAFITKNMLVNLYVWDMKTYTYTQQASTARNTGTSYPPESIRYCENGYCGTLYRTSVSNAPYTVDEGSYQTVTDSKTATDSCSNTVYTYYDQNGNMSSHSSWSVCPSSKAYSDSDGFSGTLSRVSESASGSCPSSGGPPNGSCAVTWTAYYAGTVYRTRTVWVPNPVTYNNYTGFYSGTIAKDVRQPYDVSFLRAGKPKYFIYVSDNTISQLADLQYAMYRNNTAKLILVGGQAIRNQIAHEAFIQNAKPIDQVMADVIQYLAQNNPQVPKVLRLVGEPVETHTATFDYENDSIQSDELQILHDPSVYDNPEGFAVVAGRTLSPDKRDDAWMPYRSSVTFDKPGKYTLIRRVKDQPTTDPRFAQYAYYSNESAVEVYVHRKPIADLELDFDYLLDRNMYRTNWIDRSYDLDHSVSRADTDRGIVERAVRFTHRETGEVFTSIPQELAPGTYDLEYVVRDLEGAWSDPLRRTYVLPVSPPVQFRSNLKTEDPTFSLAGVPASENLVAFDLWTRYPYAISLRFEMGNVISRNVPYYSGTKNGNDIFWTNQTFTIPATTPDGTYTFRISAVGSVDGSVATNEYSVVVRTPINLNGWVSDSSGSEVTIIRPSQAYTLRAQTTKYANTVVVTAFKGTAYQRTVTLNAGVTITNGYGARAWQAPLPQQAIPDGLYTFEWRATTPNGNVETVTKTVRVINNRPPQADFDWTPNPAYEGDLIGLLNRSTDPDGDPLSATWTVRAPNGAIIVQGDTWNILIPGNFTVNKPGAYTVTLTVRDPQGATATATKTIAVRALSVTGYVTHTVNWQEKIDRWNRGRDPDDPEYRKPDEFWAGEAFVLRADTTDTQTATVATKVEVTAYGTAIPYWWHGWGIYERLTADNPQKTRWVGKATDRSVQFTGDSNRLQNLQNGYLDFRFRATYSNGVVKEHVVRVYVRNKWTDVYQIHRAL